MVTGVDDSIGKNLSAKPSTMQKSGSHAGNGQFLKMAARLAQTDAAHDDITNPELLADKVIQRNAAGDDIPTGVAGFETQVSESHPLAPPLRGPASVSARVGANPRIPRAALL
jgi:hypothetical protein